MPEPPFQNRHSENPQTIHVSASLTGVSAFTSVGILTAGAQRGTLSTSSIIIPERPTEEGTLIRCTSLVWNEIVQALGNDWSIAYQIPPEKFAKDLQKRNGLIEIYDQIMNEKVLDMLQQNAKIEDVAPAAAAAATDVNPS